MRSIYIGQLLRPVAAPLANVYSGFGSIGNAFYLYRATAKACGSTPYRAHARTSRGCGYDLRLSTPCNCFQLQFFQGFLPVWFPDASWHHPVLVFHRELTLLH